MYGSVGATAPIDTECPRPISPVVTVAVTVWVDDSPGLRATGEVKPETDQSGIKVSLTRSNEPAALPTLVTVTSNGTTVFSDVLINSGSTVTKGKGIPGTVKVALSLALTVPLSLAVAVTLKGYEEPIGGREVPVGLT